MQPKVSIPHPIEAADLRAFVAVVDRGSISAAARSLGETKGSVSRRVSRLEAALGAALVDRSGGRVAPTEEGLLLRDKAGPAFVLLDEAVSAVRDRRGQPAGHLRITAPLGLGALVLEPVLGAFAARHPAVTFELLFTNHILSFGQDRLDLALRTARRLPDSGLIAHKVLDLSSQLYAAPSYLAVEGMPETVAELSAHRLLVPPLQGTAFPTLFGRRDGAEPAVEVVLQGHLVSDDVMVLRDAAVGGAGITLLLPAVAAPDVSAGRLCPVLPDHRAEGAALYLLTAGGTLPAKTRALRDAILEAWRPRSHGGARGEADSQAAGGAPRRAVRPSGKEGHGGDQAG